MTKKTGNLFWLPIHNIQIMIMQISDKTNKQVDIHITNIYIF